MPERAIHTVQSITTNGILIIAVVWSIKHIHDVLPVRAPVELMAINFGHVECAAELEKLNNKFIRL